MLKIKKLKKIMPKKNKKIVAVAMSGGVDSSVAAAMMVEKGYEVIGLTMQLYDSGRTTSAGSKTCCAGQDIYDAKRVSDKLGIRHYTLDYEKRFLDNVIQDFADSYAKGVTPIPCIRCNQKMKFKDLLETSLDLGAEFLVTGHYACIKGEKENIGLYRAKDLTKDQSYFLFATPQKILRNISFPLGMLSKEETRSYAKKMNLSVSDKPESQDICFVQSTAKKGYREIVQKLRPDVTKSGNIVHVNGKIMGQHYGIDAFTVGQRRGLGVISEDGTPLYVTKIDATNNTVCVGTDKDMEIKNFNISELTWIDNKPLNKTDEIIADVQLSSEQITQKATISYLDKDKLLVNLHESNYRVAPGQACVVYREDRILGGGWISGGLSL
jgi:tRNA-specific 2-thiouridylase